VFPKVGTYLQESKARAMNGSLTLRINKMLEGDAIDAGVPFTARAILDGSDRGAKRPSWTGVAAVGSARRDPPPYWAVLDLPAGRYEIEAVLPSGEILGDEVQVVANKSTELVLRGEPSPNEWRSWSHFAQSRAASTFEKASFTYRSNAPLSGLPPDLNVSMGSTFLAEGTALAAASWRDWYLWLDRRAAVLTNGDKPSKLSLSGDTFGLKLDDIHDDKGSLAIVHVSDEQSHIQPVGEFGKHRLFLCVSSERGERVSSVPWPWPRGPDGDPAANPFFELHLIERKGQLITNPTLRDPTYGGVIAYLNAGRFGRAGQLLRAARTALFEKWTNPLAAAAGGYVLLSTAESDELDHWPYWLANLAERFEGIPDGAILRAKWLLERGSRDDFEKAHDLLYDACNRGLPFFAAGVVWLIDGLRRVAVDCDVCREQLHIVQGVARSMDLSQAFTCIHLPAPDERSDGLQPRLRVRPPVYDGQAPEPELRDVFVDDGLETEDPDEEEEEEEEEAEEKGAEQAPLRRY
jgi:hypothetical protein